jgi:hypothetical protein
VEEAVDEGMSILYEPEASEDEQHELTFATVGADDAYASVALDMDTECGYITSDELSDDESEDDLDDMYM